MHVSYVLVVVLIMLKSLPALILRVFASFVNSKLFTKLLSEKTWTIYLLLQYCYIQLKEEGQTQTSSYHCSSLNKPCETSYRHIQTSHYMVYCSVVVTTQLFSSGAPHALYSWSPINTVICAVCFWFMHCCAGVYATSSRTVPGLSVKTSPSLP